PGLPPRWRPANADSRWKAIDRGFQIESTTAEADDSDWLEYEHWPGTANARLRGIAAPLTDNDSYNQGETRRPLNAVNDIFLSCRLRASGSGEFVLAARSDDQQFAVEIEPHNKVVLRMGDHTLAQKRLKTNFSRRF